MTDHEKYYDQELNRFVFDSWEDAINEAEQQLGMDATDQEVEALARELIRREQGDMGDDL